MPTLPTWLGPESRWLETKDQIMGWMICVTIKAKATTTQGICKCKMVIYSPSFRDEPDKVDLTSTTGTKNKINVLLICVRVGIVLYVFTAFNNTVKSLWLLRLIRILLFRLKLQIPEVCGLMSSLCLSSRKILRTVGVKSNFKLDWVQKVGSLNFLSPRGINFTSWDRAGRNILKNSYF